MYRLAARIYFSAYSVITLFMREFVLMYTNCDCGSGVMSRYGVGSFCHLMFEVYNLQLILDRLDMLDDCMYMYMSSMSLHTTSVVRYIAFDLFLNVSLIDSYLAIFF